jgi:hypothetical protein
MKWNAWTVPDSSGNDNRNVNRRVVSTIQILKPEANQMIDSTYAGIDKEENKKL